MNGCNIYIFEELYSEVVDAYSTYSRIEIGPRHISDVLYKKITLVSYNSRCYKYSVDCSLISPYNVKLSYSLHSHILSQQDIILIFYQEI